MKKTRKYARLLKSDCGQCSSCCRDIKVDVTDTDIERLVKHTGIPADRLVKLYSPADVSVEDEGEWINLSYGKRALELNKRRNGNCIFLATDKSCTAYEARPMTCRIFPVCVVSDDRNTIVDLELSDVITDRTITCRQARGKGRSYRSFMSVAEQSQIEDEIFKKKVDEWNSLRGRGVKKDFLSFLGFRTSNSGARQ